MAPNIPLVKYKSGNLSDVNNYRAVALPNSVSKILETSLFDFIETNNAVDNYQLGCRKNHSTSICTQVVFRKQSITTDSMEVMFFVLY